MFAPVKPSPLEQPRGFLTRIEWTGSSVGLRVRFDGRVFTVVRGRRVWAFELRPWKWSEPWARRVQ